MQYEFGEFRLDPARRELRRGGRNVHVEPQVFDLVLHLVRNRDRVVSKDDLLAAVWHGRVVSESTLSNRINAARRALADSGANQNLIRTIPRRGLRFVGEVTENDDTSMQGGRGAPASQVSAGMVSANKVGGNALAAEAHPDRDSKPAVVVLPFANLSGNPEQEHFSDGITEDITTALAKHRSLMVVARNSAFAFKGFGSDVRRVGMELGAEYIVEGSIRIEDRQIRITAHLIETETGQLIWADQFDRRLEGLFEVQDEITAKIAAGIEPKVSTAERLQAERKPSQSLRAWDLFHLGLKHLYKATNADNREAQRLFKIAIEHNPTLAQAHAWLAYAIVLSMLYFDAEPGEERLAEALDQARKGIELDDEDALIRFVHGRTLLAMQDYGDALQELRQAIETNPSSAVSYCGLADSLAYEGRFEEAFPYFQKAIDLSPYDPQRWAFYSYRALAHLFARQFEQSFEWSQKATLVPNCHYWPYVHRVSALGHLKWPRELERSIAELTQRKPEISCNWARKRLFYVKDSSQLELYVDGLRKAGLPEG